MLNSLQYYMFVYAMGGFLDDNYDNYSNKYLSSSERVAC